MATRQVKSNREKAAAIDAKIYGKERTYDREMTKMELVNALTFYNGFSRKDLDKNVITFMKKNGYSKTQIAEFSACEDWKFPMTSAKLASIIAKSGEVALPVTALAELKANINTCIEQGRANLLEASLAEEKPIVIKQDPTTKKASGIMAHIDGFIDDRDYTFDVYKYLQEQAATPVIANKIKDNYSPLLEELLLVDTKADHQLVEGYGNYKRTELKKFIKFVESIITSASTFINNTKAMKTRKPRKKKVKTADQLTAKVKYCKSFPDLRLVSIDPSKIIEASSVWIYNTKYRKLGVYIAAPNQTLSIKGTTIINYNEELSVCKTLRKPEVQLGEFSTASKVALRKFLENINGKAASLNGRLNEDIVILKAFV